MQEKLSHLVDVASKRYARRCWWMDVEDLRQVGHLALVSAQTRFDPRVGATPEQYYWRAVVLAMSRAVWADSAPVSGGRHRPSESLRGLQRAPVDELLESPAEDDPALALARAEWAARVRSRLRTLAAGSEPLLRVLLEEATPESSAVDARCRPGQLRAAVRTVRETAVFDEPLQELFEELVEE